MWIFFHGKYNFELVIFFSNRTARLSQVQMTMTKFFKFCFHSTDLPFAKWEDDQDGFHKELSRFCLGERSVTKPNHTVFQFFFRFYFNIFKTHFQWFKGKKTTNEKFVIRKNVTKNGIYEKNLLWYSSALLVFYTSLSET